MTRLVQDLPSYELILMDYSMPECDGPTACQLIRDLYAQKGILRPDQPYIAMLTAYTEKEFIEAAMKKQMDIYCVKPIFKTQMHNLLIKAGILE